MSRLSLITKQKFLRAKRTRKNTVGTTDRPRLSVSISNRHVIAQIIDDSNGKTLVYASSVGQKLDDKVMTDKAKQIGADIAKKAKTAKITKVVFDRGSKKYHGRIKALAESAREGGLEF
ncbi:MAG TPA: 50S ribosomal protein L18 [Candidatus Saccharimonadales bacterium]